MRIYLSKSGLKNKIWIVKEMEKIKEWFNKYFYVIMIIVILVTALMHNYTTQTRTEEECTDKCEDLGHRYFYSKPSSLFKEEVCKCKTNENEVIDIF